MLVLCLLASASIPINVVHGNLGPVLLEDSFEDDPLGVFGVENRTFTPDGWFPDIDLSFGDEGEVVNTVANSGNQSVRLYANAYLDTFPWYNGSMYACLLKQFPRKFPELYVSWHQLFESFPSANWKYFRVAFFTGGEEAYSNPTAWTDIIRLNDTLHIRMGKLWLREGFGQKMVSYPFQENTWYKFEMYYKYGVSDGEYRLLVNGEEVITVVGQDTTPRDTITGEQYAGAEILDNFPDGWDGGVESLDNLSPHAAYIDDVIFASFFFGRESGAGYLVLTANTGITEIPANVAVSNETFSVQVVTPSTLVLEEGEYNLEAAFEDQRNNASVRVVATQIASIAFRFKRRTAMTTLIGIVRDEKGNPIENATTYCIGEETYSTTTDQSGAYSLTMPVGNYTVLFVKQGVQGESRKAELLVGDTLYTIDVILKPLPQLPFDPLPIVIAAIAAGIGALALSWRKERRSKP